ncbi:unnamed protein product [Tilletia controversa]|uniref:Uncharacterized protein n=1 Tax=Tilletia controversa TaxID=13291 RepID=A0A8X7T036_9BASI|nr:hypothetical protein CF328_g3169 [Tilletia controversa]KAE8254409.1 hypothetical protein A4X06_0g920 [Tilletia controversa]CAD6938504.1 unnamed protein product [Tilletia controversa]
MGRMPKTIPGRPRRMWTPAEDAKLKAMVKAAGDKVPRWSEIAKSLDGRNRKDVRKRWSYCLNPTLTKGAWSKQEDTLLRAAINDLGTDEWVHVASRVGSRTGDQCAKRWRDVLDPSIAHERWTPADDAKLMDLTKTFGHNWSLIATHFPGRRGVQCRNRSHSLSKRQEMSGKASNGTNTATRFRSRVTLPTPVPSSTSSSSSSQGLLQDSAGPPMATLPWWNPMTQTHLTSTPVGSEHDVLSPGWLAAPESVRNLNPSNSMAFVQQLPDSEFSFKHNGSLAGSSQRFPEVPILPGMFALLSSLNPAHPDSVMSQQFSPPQPPPQVPAELPWAPQNGAFFVTAAPSEPPLANAQSSEMFNGFRPFRLPPGSEIKPGHSTAPILDSGMTVPAASTSTAHPFTSWGAPNMCVPIGYHPSPTDSQYGSSTAPSQSSSFQEGSVGGSSITTASFFFHSPPGTSVGRAQPSHHPQTHHQYAQPSTPSETGCHSSGPPYPASSAEIHSKMAMFLGGV